MISLAIKRHFPKGIWPESMTPKSVDDSKDAFRRIVYPIWKPIADADFATEWAMTNEQIKAATIESDCLTTQKQDLAIYASGHKPIRTDENQEKMYALRAKAAKAAGMGAY